MLGALGRDSSWLWFVAAASVLGSAGAGVWHHHAARARRHGHAGHRAHAPGETIEFGGIQGFPRLDAFVDGLVLSADGTTAALFAADAVVAIDVPTGRELRRSKEASRAGGIALSSDGSKLAVALPSRGEIAVRDVRGTGRALIVPVADLPEEGVALAFSPDGDRLAVGVDARKGFLDPHHAGVRVMSLATKKQLLAFPFARGGPLALAIRGDQVVAVTGDRVDPRVDVEFHGASGQPVRVLPIAAQAGASGGTAAAELSADGRTLGLTAYLSSGVPSRSPAAPPGLRALTRYYSIDDGAPLSETTDGAHPFVAAGATEDSVRGELLARGGGGAGIHRSLRVPHPTGCEVTRAAGAPSGAIAALVACASSAEMALYAPASDVAAARLGLRHCKLDRVAFEGGRVHASGLSPDGCDWTSGADPSRGASPPGDAGADPKGGAAAEAPDHSARAFVNPEGVLRLSNARGNAAWIHIVNGIVIALADDGRVEVRGDGRGIVACRLGDRSLPFEACARELSTSDVVGSILRGDPQSPTLTRAR